MCGVGLFVVWSVWMAYSSTIISATQLISTSGLIRVPRDLLLALGYFRHKRPPLYISPKKHINLAWKCNPWTHDGPAGGWTSNLSIRGVTLLPTEPPEMAWSTMLPWLHGGDKEASEASQWESDAGEDTIWCILYGVGFQRICTGSKQRRHDGSQARTN